MNIRTHYSQGFVALITVLVVTAVALILATASTYRAISEGKIGLNEMQSAQAWASANGCVEHALGEYSVASTTWDLSSGYLGGQGMTIGGVSCYISSTAATGTGLLYRLINASSTVSGYVRKLQVVVATNTPASAIATWAEVGDF